MKTELISLLMSFRQIENLDDNISVPCIVDAQTSESFTSVASRSSECSGGVRADQPCCLLKGQPLPSRVVIVRIEESVVSPPKK